MQRLTPERVARMRLVAQGLIEPWPTPVEAARSLTCTQGQDYPGSTVSLALRSSAGTGGGAGGGSGHSPGHRTVRRTGGTTAAVRQAYDAGLIVRSWPMRGTLFVVASEDLGWILGLTAEKMLTSTRRRREELGLDPATLSAAETIALRELSGAGLTRAARGEVQDQLEGADVGGREHWMAAGLPDRFAHRVRATAAPLLLPGFDEIVLGYQDRSAVLTKAEEARVVPGGNGVFKGTVLHRGHAVGTWKGSTGTGRPVQVEPFGALPAPVQTAVPRLSARLPG